MSTVTLTQNEIADGVEELNPNFAWLLREGEALLTSEESPFISRHSVVRVEIVSASHPVLFFVAKKPDGTVALLTGNPEAFLEMIPPEKIRIKEDQAVAYTDFYVETTQEMEKPLFALNSFDDIPYLHELDAEQLQKKHRDKNKYGERIKPPVVKKEGDSFRVQRYFLNGTELQLWTFTIAEDGSVNVSRETIDPDVGIYYWK